MIRKTLTLLIAAVSALVLIANLSCTGGSRQPMTQRPIEQVLKSHTDSLMAIPGVVGTAIGEFEGKPCIKVLVVKKTKELDQKLPAVLEGYRVVVDETGEIKALDRK
jgi:hypothetical protein